MLIFSIIDDVKSIFNNAVKQYNELKFEYNNAIRKNIGDIDGACMKFGNVEVCIEGPKNSIWKGIKSRFIGKKDYSAKVKIAGKKIGKINFF